MWQDKEGGGEGQSSLPFTKVRKEKCLNPPDLIMFHMRILKKNGGPILMYLGKKILTLATTCSYTILINPSINIWARK